MAGLLLKAQYIPDGKGNNLKISPFRNQKEIREYKKNIEAKKNEVKEIKKNSKEKNNEIKEKKDKQIKVLNINEKIVQNNKKTKKPTLNQISLNNEKNKENKKINEETSTTIVNNPNKKQKTYVEILTDKIEIEDEYEDESEIKEVDILKQEMNKNQKNYINNHFPAESNYE